MRRASLTHTQCRTRPGGGLAAFSLSLLALACTPVIAQDREVDSAAAEQAARAFLRWHAQPRTQGYSAPPQALQLRQLLSAELLCLLQATDRFRDRYVRAAPDEKPPYADGDLFSSSVWEPAVKRDVESVRVRSGRASVLVWFEDGDGVSWRDRLQLRREAGRWKVDDVDRLALFQQADGTPAVGTPASLRTSLYETLDKDLPQVRWRRQEVRPCASSHRS